MADGHGGYRKPANPAPVSGPGAHSQRTDGGPAQVLSAAPDQPYGDAKAQLDAQRIAPMAGTQPLPTPPSSNDIASQATQPYSGGAFNAPSVRPNEPVTTGVPIGPGAGPEALSLGPGAATRMGPANGSMTQLLGRLMATDTTGVLAKLYDQAAARGV